MDGRDASRKRLIGQLEGTAGEIISSPTKSATASPTTGRITIRETGDGLVVRVPAVKHVIILAFLLVWLGGWSVGEWFALSEILSGGFGSPDLFLLFWVTLWSLGGLVAWSIVLRQLFGAERLFITGGALVKESGIGPFRRRRIWELTKVSGFRKQDATGSGVVFEAEGKEQSFGAGMTSEENDAVLAALGRHLPREARPATAPANPWSH